MIRCVGGFSSAGTVSQTKMLAAVIAALAVGASQAQAYQKTITNANVVTPSGADANHPFAAPTQADISNAVPHSVEPPEVVSNPATDTSYLPNVVNSEDGIANNLAAYTAQSIAARAYLYYTQPTNGGYIINSQLNQVYSQVGGAATPTANGATALEEQAVRMSDGIILEYGTSNTITTGDIPIEGFFVAGGIPTTSNTPFGHAGTDATSDPTGTQPDVTYNRGLTGNNVTGTPLGYTGTPGNPNPVNRGALSQNGINFLTTHSDPTTGATFNYNDALRYYYGADIHMTVVTPNSTADYVQHPITVENFATDNGYFGNGKTNSTNNVNVTSASSTHSSTAVANTPIVGAQVLSITSGTAFSYDDVAGLGPNSIQTDAGGVSSAVSLLGDAAVNLNMPSIGTISFYAKVDAGPGGTVALVLNDDTTGLTHASVPLALIPDAGFQRYTIALSAVPGMTTGLAADFSLNAFRFTGLGNETYELAGIEFNETGVPEPTAIASLMSIGLLALNRRRLA